MHQIFVTLEDFLANGGTLNDGKGLFTLVKPCTYYDTGSIYKNIGWYDAFTKPAPEGMVTVATSDRTYHMETCMVYVAIEATPIYK
jgi:hypothetical protein